MTEVRRGTVALFILCSACQPLDRRDGALVIALVRAPSDVDAIEVTVRAGGRTFTELVPRPSDDRITAFSAVPVGPAVVDLRLFAGAQIVETRVAIEVVILEDQTVEVPVNFESGPDFDIIEPVEGEPHLLSRGELIPLLIRPVNSALDIAVTASIDEAPIAVDMFASDFGATIEIDVPDVLPHTFALKVEACLRRSPSDCIEKMREVVVTRAPWRIHVAEESRSRPKLWREKLVLCDGEGALRVVTATSGEYLDFPLFLESPISEDIALVEDTVYATSANGRLYTIDLNDDEIPYAQIGATSAPVAWGNEVIVAADTELLRVSDMAVVAALPRRVRAAPLFDGEGIVAADILGNVRAFDETGAQLFSVSVGSPVFAPPIRRGDRIAIATSAGELVQLDEISGAEIAPRIDLGLPLVFAPVVIADRMIAVADDQVVFIEDDRIAVTVTVGGTITSPPVPWRDGVIIGERSGLVRWVTDTRNRIIERVDGAALSALVIDSLGAGRGIGIAVVGSRGDLAMLEPEADF